jgi:hypothetical protein
MLFVDKEEDGSEGNGKEVLGRGKAKRDDAIQGYRISGQMRAGTLWEGSRSTAGRAKRYCSIQGRVGWDFSSGCLAQRGGSSKRV